MSNTILKNTAYLSLFVQAITGLVDIWGLSLPVPETANIFRQLLMIELGVQVIEFIFYVWMTLHIHEKKNITVYRYLDWFITTPSMLITLMAYLDTSQDITSLGQFFQRYGSVILVVLVLNWIMLGLGLMGELGWIPERKAALLGFIPFVLYYFILYQNFIQDKNITKDQRNVYFYFIFIWSLYGVAALMSYEIKNAMYNILDLFAKNFFGLFLVTILYRKSKSFQKVRENFSNQGNKK
jgi:bacteriorhodopsin